MDLKAFAVTEHDENTGAVIFAKHDIVARRIGADEYADGELSYVSCRRALMPMPTRRSPLVS
jgi:hypothetical protein